MRSLAARYKKELLREIDGLPSKEIKGVIDFVCFIKAKKAIDPTQVYFWTKRWQEMENEADRDKEAGKILGDGIVKDLLKKLMEDLKSVISAYPKTFRKRLRSS